MELPPAARIAYPASAHAFLHQQILVLAGTLDFHEGDEEHRLKQGDCLQLGPPSPTVFANRGKTPCRYLVALVKR